MNTPAPTVERHTHCVICGAPLPEDANITRKYCSGTACKNEAAKRKYHETKNMNCSWCGYRKDERDHRGCIAALKAHEKQEEERCAEALRELERKQRYRARFDVRPLGLPRAATLAEAEAMLH